MRDIYDLGDRLLLVATDRISAFDVVMPNGIPDKGEVLTRISQFWFELHQGHPPPPDRGRSRQKAPPGFEPYLDQLAGRAMLVKKTKVVPIECVVRGYIAGSGWKEYQKTQRSAASSCPPACGSATSCPSRSSPRHQGGDRPRREHLVRAGLPDSSARRSMETVRERSISVYTQAADYARQRGVIIADTKFEWGFDGGELILIDEVLTPDSSRFWPADQYEPGHDQPSFDKQFVRNYLETLNWNKTPPGPTLPDDVVARHRQEVHRGLRATHRPQVSEVTVERRCERRGRPRTYPDHRALLDCRSIRRWYRWLQNVMTAD